MTWSAPVAVMGVPTFATQPIVTMTTDELTVAWVLDAGGGVGNVFVADRASPTDAFPAPLPLSVGGAVDAGPDAAPPPPPTDAGIAAINYFAFERVAFSDDGRTLIGVSVGGRHLAEFIRVERGAAFFPQPMESRFTSLESTLNAGEVLADPVSSASGTDLVYSRYGSGGSISVYESVQNGSSDWPTGTPQEGLPLALLVLGEPKRPTSMTNDQLTLFVWDEASNAAYGVFRGSPNTQFNFSVRYGAFFSAQVNADCSRLYYVAQGTGGYTLEHVDAQ